MRHLPTALLASLVLAACAQAQKPVALAPASIEDREPDVTRQVQSVLEAVAQEQLPRSALTDNALGALPPAQLQAMGVALRSCGAMPQLQLLSRRTKGEERMYIYRAPCGGRPLLVEINFGKGERISRLVLRAQ
ncbi:hypothetical protein KY495_15115 [Massilia sp. PAMC28688]|uniref:hypothetical protein n=1 Tax=Massilia sp. PAMC28688 TaxID=2861283 RepID=UPI001C636DF4|nr:hypothetical protein [Massilia sp. PAMC28688]QYF92096.1 hypothetical protein KY495_15115 [Massilia sp. PAMC28688]